MRKEFQELADGKSKHELLLGGLIRGAAAIVSQDRLEPKVTDILRRICWSPESIKYTALIIAGYPQSVEDDILNERLKNSFMGTQVRGRINETDEMDSRGKVCGSDEMP